MSSWFLTYGYAEVLDNLIIGAYPLDERDVELLSFVRVERVLNLVEDTEYRRGERRAVEFALARAGIDEYRLELVDYAGIAAEQLEIAIERVNAWLDEGIRTYVHCRAGWQRSAAVAAGVVALREGIDIDTALAVVQQRKPTADPLPNQRADLRAWWESRQANAPQPEP